MNAIGKCDQCGGSFSYDLIHNGFNESAYAYCDECGMLSILDGWKIPDGVKLTIHRMITPDIEPLLAPCPCGGQFRAGAPPRCPHCRSPVSAKEAATWIEANAPGTKAGWRWQRNWSGLYAISIEKRFIRDTWKGTG
jgi:hypothetical protein